MKCLWCDSEDELDSRENGLIGSGDDVRHVTQYWCIFCANGLWYEDNFLMMYWDRTHPKWRHFGDGCLLVGKEIIK